MSKFELIPRARFLRAKGMSIKDIAQELNISKSTASAWCADIVLSTAQLRELQKKRVSRGQAGRLAGAMFHKKKKQARMKFFWDQGLKDTKKLGSRDFLMVGLGLYMGEGNKSGNRFQFTNSNPALIRLMILWLKRNFRISRERIYCRILINEIHADRVAMVERQWSSLLAIPKDQFRKTILIKSKSKKTYENRDIHLGTIILRVQSSSDLQYRVLGLLNGLMYNIDVKMPA
ncbi:MAG: hypothetical protein A2855_00245 [Candidatus Liptonbacteria bacterium RIFCSPHIGHO2_01_FULL_57_28]|uniref:Uncharacterized protein n=1 Tax=Candidatus Liptonbacteria bacterium RIFCSPHIGHO2_01_FULL_57_28 TaxID=1798647 RepID=A0A1G2CAS8_9BACT|nr:MAG: hypothetical protein A2855_00245 [Candidatus Liptonbacteria bacterium RIFCSPHIGHO2_01_FULL_57_28]